MCTCLGLRVPSQCRCPGPGCHTGREGGRRCRPRALTKLLQYSRLARATTRWPQWVVLGGSPISPPLLNYNSADATLVHLSHQTVNFPIYNSPLQLWVYSREGLGKAFFDQVPSGVSAPAHCGVRQACPSHTALSSATAQYGTLTLRLLVPGPVSDPIEDRGVTQAEVRPPGQAYLILGRPKST